jgi:ligand-binding SRPBCC domain-containing protein
VPRSPDQVFPFFADARNLELLTPPWLRFEIQTPGPIDLKVGTLIDYRLRLHGLPVRWRTRIARYEPPHAFADEQLRGPYTVWHHTHTFTPCDGGTVLGDHVVMRPKGGLLAPLVMNAFVRRDVQRIFEYRANVMTELFGGVRGQHEVRWEHDLAAAPLANVG